MAKSKKIGLDLIRVIAAFAVVVLHSGDDALVPITRNAEILRSYFVFPVPVFLALSFYLSSKSILEKEQFNLAKKLTKLLIPYFFFSAVYLFYDAIEITDLSLLPYLQRVFSPPMQDPIGILLLGGAYVHLYFFPLLIVGTIALHYMGGWLKQQNTIQILGLAGASAFAHHWLRLSGNAFTIQGPNTAFKSLLPAIVDNPLLRILLTSGALLIQCLPYMLIAFFIASKTSKLEQDVERPRDDLSSSRMQSGVKTIWSNRQKLIIGLMCLVLTILLLAFQSTLFPDNRVLRDITLAFLLLIFGLGISHKIDGETFFAKAVVAISQVSFGIYLLHHIYIGLFKKIEVFLPFYNPETITATRIFIFAVSSFVISYITMTLLSQFIRHKRARQCLGL
ncbi:MAG: acyltransferase [Cyanobacteria bacterium J06643_4]